MSSHKMGHKFKDIKVDRDRLINLSCNAVATLLLHLPYLLCLIIFMRMKKRERARERLRRWRRKKLNLSQTNKAASVILKYQARGQMMRVNSELGKVS